MLDQAVQVVSFTLVEISAVYQSARPETYPGHAAVHQPIRPRSDKMRLSEFPAHSGHPASSHLRSALLPGTRTPPALIDGLPSRCLHSSCHMTSDMHSCSAAVAFTTSLVSAHNPIRPSTSGTLPFLSHCLTRCHVAYQAIRLRPRHARSIGAWQESDYSWHFWPILSMASIRLSKSLPRC